MGKMVSRGSECSPARSLGCSLGCAAARAVWRPAGCPPSPPHSPHPPGTCCCPYFSAPAPASATALPSLSPLLTVTHKGGRCGAFSSNL